MQGEMWQYQSKPTLLDLRGMYGFSIVHLADKAMVEPSVVYSMLLGRPIARSQAFQVIEGLSRLIGVNYTLSDVDVTLVDDEV